MSKVYVIDAKRTAIGAFLGSLSTVHPADFGAVVVKNIIETNKINPADLDELIIGNILPAGQGQGIGRQVGIKAGIPVTVPGYAVNMVCGSGMKAVMSAYANIKSGLHNLVIAGGTESMSQAPHLLPSAVRTGYKMGDIKAKDHMIFDALTDAYEGYHMGITAENIVEKHSITREEQDTFAMTSIERSIHSVDTGRFADEIVPVEVKLRKETIVFDKDEHPNRRSTLEKLGTLRAAFKRDGSVTAGNASGINDGASMMLLASEAYVNEHNLEPIAEVIAVGQGGVDPSVMGLGPVPAIANALKQAELTLADIELLELNEAFAAQSIGVVKELSEAHNQTFEEIVERTNVNGGAIGLGHPVGASGNRIMTTLVHEMIKRDSKLGLASLCIGGGMGTAVILKRK